MNSEHTTSSGTSHWLQQLAISFWVLFTIIVVAKCFIAPYSHSVYPGYATVGRVWWFGSKEIGLGVYGPFFAQIIGPFSWLSNELGGALWYIFSFAFFLSGYYKFLTKVVPDEQTSKTLSIAFMLVPWFGIASFYNGQANILLAGCFLWATVAILNHYWLLASFALAAPVSIKAYPIAMAMVLIGLYPRKLFLKFLFSLILLLCLPFLFHESGFVLLQYEDWLSYLIGGARYNNPGLVHIDFRTFLNRWFVTISPKDYIPIQAITGVLVFLCLFISHLYRVSERQTVVNAYILTSIWLVLFGPASEEATYLLISPSISWLLISAYRHEKMTQLVYLGIAALFIGPFQTSILGEAFRKWMLVQKLAPLALAIFFLVQLGKIYQQPLGKISNPFSNQ